MEDLLAMMRCKRCDLITVRPLCAVCNVEMRRRSTLLCPDESLVEFLRYLFHPEAYRKFYRLEMAENA